MDASAKASEGKIAEFSRSKYDGTLREGDKEQGVSNRFGVSSGTVS
jgi:hypothetical protein